MVMANDFIGNAKISANWFYLALAWVSFNDALRCRHTNRELTRFHLSCARDWMRLACGQ
jgi:hypothetical protein